MKGVESQRSSANAGRAPSWEKQNRNPYFIVMIIALLLSAACLYLWSKDRAETKLMLAASLTEQAEVSLPHIAEGFSSVFRSYGEKWQFFVEEIELAALHDADREHLSGLPASLFTDENLRGAWIFLERDEARGEPFFAINSKRHDSQMGADYAEKVTQGDYYATAKERNALRIKPIVRSEIDMNSVLFSSIYSYSSSIKERLSLLVDGPVTREGDFAGIAGFEVEIPNVKEQFYSAVYLSNMDLFLIDPNGEIVMSSSGVFTGEHYRKIEQEGYADALTACALGVATGERFDAFLTGRGSTLTFASYVPVDASDGGPPWFLAALNGMYQVRKAGKGYLLALFLVWFTALCVAVSIYETRKRRASKIETQQAVAEMQPEAAEFFKKHERHRKACYLLCAIFCVPGMFILTIYEKRYKAALSASDIEAAAKELSGMKKITAVSVLVGSVFIYIHIILD